MINLRWPFGKTRVVMCSDGSERTIYKNPDDAFPLVARDWSAKTEAAVIALNELQTKLGADIQKHVAGFFTQVDEANRSMQIAFRAIYVTYTTYPCNLDGWLQKEVSKVIARENKNRLTRLELEIRKIESLESQGRGKQDLERAIEKAQNRLSKSDNEEKTSNEFKKVEKNTSAWMEGRQ